MKVRDIISSLSNEKLNIDKSLANLKDVNPKDVSKLIHSSYDNSDKLSFISSIISKDLTKDELEKSISIINKDQDSIDRIKKNALDNFITEIKNKGLKEDIPNISSLNYSDSFNALKYIIDDPKYNKIYNDTITKSYRDNISGSFQRNPLDTFNSLESFIKDDEKIEKSFNLFSQSKKRDYKYIESETIDEISNEYKDSQYKESIKYIKENILKQRNDKDLGNDSKMAEEIASSTKKVHLLNAPKNEYFDKYLEDNGSTLIFKAGISNIDDTQTLDKNLRENEINISSDKQDIILDSLNQLNSMKNYKNGKELLDLDTYKNEEGIKVYGFKNFYNLNNDIVDAVKNKDVKKMDELYKIHKKETKTMDNLISTLNKLDQSSIPGNISNARNDSMPVKYTEDFKSSSMVNGLWHLNAFLKYNNIDAKKFLKKPVDTYIDFLKNNEKLNEINDLGKNGDIDFLKNITNPKTKSKMNGLLMNKYNNFRAFEFLSITDDKHMDKNFFSYQYFKQTKLAAPYIEKTKELNNIFSSLDANKIKNVLLNQDEKNKYLDLISNNFDSKSYLDNNDINIDKYVSKIESLNAELNSNGFNSKNKEIKDAIKLSSIDLLKSKNLTSSKDFNKICAFAGLENYKAIRLTAGTKDIAEYVNNQYTNIAKDGINKDNIIEAANSLKSISDQYNKRGFFGKYFRGEGRAEKRLMNQIKKDMISSGISKNEIDSFTSGKTNLDDFTNSFNNSLKDEKTIDNNTVKMDIKEFDNEFDFSLNNKEKIETKELNKNLEIDNEVEL